MYTNPATKLGAALFSVYDRTGAAALARDLAARGMTMLVVTHEMNFARDVAQKVVYLDGGVLVEQGTPEQIFSNPQHESTRLFLERVR